MIIGGGNNDLSRVARDGDMGRMGVLLGLLADADGTEASSTKDQRWTWRLFMFAVRPQEINRIWTLHCGYGQLRMTTCFMVLKEYFLRKIFIADFPNLSPFPQACTTRCENISVNKKTRLVKLRSQGVTVRTSSPSSVIDGRRRVPPGPKKLEILNYAPDVFIKTS